MPIIRCYHKDTLWNDSQNAIIQRMHKINASAVFLYSFGLIKQIRKIMYFKNAHYHN